MFDIPFLLVLVPGVCLVATVVTAALGPHILGPRSHWPVVVALVIAAAASGVLVVQVHHQALAQWGEGRPADPAAGYEKIVTLWQWASIDDAHYAHQGDRFRIEVALRADPLTAVMLLTVTSVALLVAVYSIGYMAGDPGYWRFFTYVSLFVFSMTMLVSVSNFVLLYVFWEAVGLCSYLLIGFWYQKPAAAAAGKKAFLVNRVGDFGFALAVFLIWTTFGTLNFHDTVDAAGHIIGGVLGQSGLARPEFWYAPGWTLSAICLLLMLGACGKSAQLPLHVWLPDAMEGPTPVSALIHAATMVTAGVYLVARCAPLFVASRDVPPIVAGIGAATALVAAIIALTQTDLKRILAYSTISQLGYMFLGLGAGTLAGVSAGMFHLVTHAFFKGLLFLAAGSVMHAMGGVIDLERFGGLRQRLPITHWTFLIGCLALAGFPLLSGFFSKDEILSAVYERGLDGRDAQWYYVLFWMGLATAGMTAFYTFRAYFRAFWGPERIPPEAGHHAHESPPVMTRPLVALAVFSAGLGAVLWLSGALEQFLEATPSLVFLATHPAPWVYNVVEGHGVVPVAGTLVALAGIGLAWLLYVRQPQWLAQTVRVLHALGLYQFSKGKMFFDEAYQALVVAPLAAFARTCARWDHALIDGLVDAVGALPSTLGRALRPLQPGIVPFYALAMVLATLVLLGAMLW